jgi:hypothetical protein
MAVYARYDAYPLDALQRRVLKASLFSIWGVSYAWSNSGSGVRDLMGVPYTSLGLPAFVYQAAIGFFLISTAAAVFVVLWRNFRDRGAVPSANFLVPWVAFIVWWLPPLIQMDYFLMVVPIFHSVQYLVFVYRVEATRLDEQHPGEQSGRGAITVLALLLSGFIAFELLPNTLDVGLGVEAAMNAWFFSAAALIFINVHHYFIDNVLWRSKNREVTRYLR